MEEMCSFGSLGSCVNACDLTVCGEKRKARTGFHASGSMSVYRGLSAPGVGMTFASGKENDSLEALVLHDFCSFDQK